MQLSNKLATESDNVPRPSHYARYKNARGQKRACAFRPLAQGKHWVRDNFREQTAAIEAYMDSTSIENYMEEGPGGGRCSRPAAAGSSSLNPAISDNFMDIPVVARLAESRTCRQIVPLCKKSCAPQKGCTAVFRCRPALHASSSQNEEAKVLSNQASDSMAWSLRENPCPTYNGFAGLISNKIHDRQNKLCYSPRKNKPNDLIRAINNTPEGVLIQECTEVLPTANALLARLPNEILAALEKKNKLLQGQRKTYLKANVSALESSLARSYEAILLVHWCSSLSFRLREQNSRMRMMLMASLDLRTDGGKITEAELARALHERGLLKSIANQCASQAKSNKIIATELEERLARVKLREASIKRHMFEVVSLSNLKINEQRQEHQNKLSQIAEELDNTIKALEYDCEVKIKRANITCERTMKGLENEHSDIIKQQNARVSALEKTLKDEGQLHSTNIQQLQSCLAQTQRYRDATIQKCKEVETTIIQARETSKREAECLKGRITACREEANKFFNDAVKAQDEFSVVTKQAAKTQEEQSEKVMELEQQKNTLAQRLVKERKDEEKAHNIVAIAKKEIHRLQNLRTKKRLVFKPSLISVLPNAAAEAKPLPPALATTPVEESVAIIRRPTLAKLRESGETEAVAKPDSRAAARTAYMGSFLVGRTSSDIQRAYHELTKKDERTKPEVYGIEKKAPNLGDAATMTQRLVGELQPLRTQAPTKSPSLDTEQVAPTAFQPQIAPPIADETSLSVVEQVQTKTLPVKKVSTTAEEAVPTFEKGTLIGKKTVSKALAPEEAPSIARTAIAKLVDNGDRSVMQKRLLIVEEEDPNVLRGKKMLSTVEEAAEKFAPPKKSSPTEKKKVSKAVPSKGALPVKRAAATKPFDSANGSPRQKTELEAYGEAINRPTATAHMLIDKFRTMDARPPISTAKQQESDSKQLTVSPTTSLKAERKIAQLLKQGESSNGLAKRGSILQNVRRLNKPVESPEYQGMLISPEYLEPFFRIDTVASPETAKIEKEDNKPAREDRQSSVTNKEYDDILRAAFGAAAIDKVRAHDDGDKADERPNEASTRLTRTRRRLMLLRLRMMSVVSSCQLLSLRMRLSHDGDFVVVKTTEEADNTLIASAGL